jgi:triacylglycerol lipase
MNRRVCLQLLAACAVVVTACSSAPSRDTSHPPIVFVHGHGGNAAQWMTTLWRFESNGWPRDRLFALDTVYPFARTEDNKPQEARSSTAEHTGQLAALVERVRRATGADKVILIAHSRGGNAIRDYVRNGAGRTTVSHAILAGTPNHGTYATAEFQPGSEFNGLGPFLTAMNQPQGPDGVEVTPGIAFMTIRSDSQDKFTQPTGHWIGQPTLKTNVHHDSPALKGAENVVLPGADHLEAAFSHEAFANAFRFVTGRLPHSDIVPEKTVRLGGKINGLAGITPTNLPVPGARVEIFEVSSATGERLGAPVHTSVTAADGRWGPFVGRPEAFYEFVVHADSYAILHVYRRPFARSSEIVDMRLGRLAEADKGATSVVVMQSPMRYFALGRGPLSLDGKTPPGIKEGIPSENQSVVRLGEPAMRTVVAEAAGQRLAVKAWPARENRLVRAVFHN